MLENDIRVFKVLHYCIVVSAVICLLKFWSHITAGSDIEATLESWELRMFLCISSTICCPAPKSPYKPVLMHCATSVIPARSILFPCFFWLYSKASTQPSGMTEFQHCHWCFVWKIRNYYVYLLSRFFLFKLYYISHHPLFYTKLSSCLKSMQSIRTLWCKEIAGCPALQTLPETIT